MLKFIVAVIANQQDLAHAGHLERSEYNTKAGMYTIQYTALYAALNKASCCTMLYLSTGGDMVVYHGLAGNREKRLGHFEGQGPESSAYGMV